MLRIKSFLLAISLSPLFSISFLLPSQAQINSKNTPGTASGAGTNGSGGTVFSAPSTPVIVPSSASPNVIVSSGGQITVPQAVQTSVNAAAVAIVTAAAGGTAGEQATVAIITSSSLVPSNIASAISNLPQTVAAIAPVNSGNAFSLSIALPSGSIQISGSPATGAQIVLSVPGQSSVTVSVPPGVLNPAAAVTAATAVLSAGGNQSQAQTAAALAGTGGNVVAAIALVTALSGLAPGGTQASNATSPTVARQNSSILVATLNLNSLFIKDLNLEKNITLAQSATANVDVGKLNTAILAYNNLIDTSSSEAVSALAKKAEFIAIGQTLRKLRSTVVR